MATVVVGIPTKNEESTIARTVRVADEGLRLLGLPAIIINCDSRSSDATTKEFAAVPTRADKESLTVADEPQGKGANVDRILARAAELEASTVVLLDADVVTVEPDWVPLLAQPVLDGHADYVSSSYVASQGGPLRHLISRPVIYGLLGADIAQPTGGEVALSARLAGYVNDIPFEDSDRRYGIDIMIAAEVAARRLPFAVVDLGSKVHRARPWSTIDGIARDVFESALRSYRRSRRLAVPADHPSLQRPMLEPIAAPSSAVTPPRADGKIVDTVELQSRWLRERHHFKALYKDVLPESLDRLIHAESQAAVPHDLWMGVVQSFARACLARSRTDAELSIALMPIFLGRMAGFATEISNRSPADLSDMLHRSLKDLFRSMRN